MAEPTAWAYRCHTCGATFTAWAPAQRHADEHHHARLELVLP
jgi:hypothetical protein